MIRVALAQLLDGRELTREQAREAMGTIMDGDATPAQIGGFLVALRLKGETVDEIAGFAEAIREHVLAVRHRELPVDGVQFHPESVLTPVGRELAANFLGRVR